MHLCRVHCRKKSMIEKQIFKHTNRHGVSSQNLHGSMWMPASLMNNTADGPFRWPWFLCRQTIYTSNKVVVFLMNDAMWMGFFFCMYKDAFLVASVYYLRRCYCHQAVLSVLYILKGKQQPFFSRGYHIFFSGLIVSKNCIYSVALVLVLRVLVRERESAAGKAERVQVQDKGEHWNNQATS